MRKAAYKSGIIRIVFEGDYPDELSKELLDESGIELVRYGG
jgi:dCMP deaminase